uniref:SET domain-containing protein n=1 Tax=Panagrolaimus davidi TaxID=227884 RepID=A0A914P9P6_9BILA
MIVFATDDIKKGDEICISYINPLSNYLERKKELSGWGFICQCELCEMDVKDPMYSERNEMWEEFKKFSTEFLPKEIIAKGEALLRKIRKSYIDGNKYKVVLAELLWILSSAYIQTGNTTTSVQYLEEVIKIMDNPLKYHYKIAEICVSLAIYYESTGDLQKSVQMIEKAMESKFCNDKSQFKLYFPEISHLL